MQCMTRGTRDCSCASTTKADTLKLDCELLGQHPKNRKPGSELLNLCAVWCGHSSLELPLMSLL